jgi:thioredoxin reductase (NADPH)
LSIIETRREQIFPVLSAAQIAIARKFGANPPRQFSPGAQIAAIGDRDVPAMLVLGGHIVIHRRDGAGRQGVVTVHGKGSMAGEIAQLSGRPALVEVRAGDAGCEVVTFDAAQLRSLLIGSAELGEIIMRALILRRTALIADGGAGAVIIGGRAQKAAVRLEGFLGRNGLPYSFFDVNADADAQALVEKLGVEDTDLPLVLCPNGVVLKNPSDVEAGACLGITPELDPDKQYDLAVIGAGPAGLAAAVYAASEGLSVLIVDARAYGGQAGASARIENYLGFPTGISGHALAARAFNQAMKFGAEIAIPVQAESLICGGDDRKPGDLLDLKLAGGGVTRSRSVVIASGARYRRLPIDNLQQFEGVGVSYWATPVESKLCEGEEVVLVGAGNSAGQAVAFLAPRVRKLHLVVRGASLGASMSLYLVQRIAACSNVVLHPQTEVSRLGGDPTAGLQSVELRSRVSGETQIVTCCHLFSFIGADPHTDWLAGCEVQRDAKGFVRTGEPFSPAGWSNFGRPPLPLETSVPGVFAIGDVRAGSTKRVAAAVGEGAQVVASIHQFLAAL